MGMVSFPTLIATPPERQCRLLIEGELPTAQLPAAVGLRYSYFR